MQEITISLSKKRLYLLFGGSILFVVLSVILMAMILLGKLERNTAGASVAAISGTIFFAAIAIMLQRKLFDKRPGLSINAEGIFENSGGSPAGFIAWEDILGFEHHRFRNQEIIAVNVKNPKIYIARQTNFISKKFMELNYKMYGTPVCITANGLNCNLGTLMHLIGQAYNEIKGNNLCEN